MMALHKRASVARQVTRLTLLAGMAGTLSFALCDLPARAQQAAPAEPAAATAPKKAKSKAKVKPATQEAKAAKKDPAVAQQQLDAGIASLNAGKAELAVQQFTSVLTGGSIASSVMAKAQYQRGIAYRKLSKPALAISDLTQALWLKNGLNETERADALQNRIAAYRDAGLPDQADADGGKAAPTRTAAAEASAVSSGTGSTGSIPTPKPSASLAPTQDNAPQASGSGLGGFFGNLFGGTNSASNAAPAPAPVAKTESAVSAWSAGTEVRAASAAQPKATRQAVAAAHPTTSDAPLPWLQNDTAKPAGKAPAPAVASAAGVIAPAAKSSGRYLLQVGQMKSPEEAQAVAAKLKQQFVAELAGREPSIVAVSAGGFGTLHRVSFGPFLDPAEWKSLCPKLLSAGHDCQPLKQ